MVQIGLLELQITVLGAQPLSLELKRLGSDRTILPDCGKPTGAGLTAP
jgi:hypothetical protein